MSHNKFFEDEFMACHKKYVSLDWKCECGFNNFEDADEFLHDFVKDGNTTIIPVKQFWPDHIKKSIIQHELIPRVKIVSPNLFNKEKNI